MGHEKIKIIIIVIAVFGLLFMGWQWYSSGFALLGNGNAKIIKVGKAELAVEVADTLPAQRQGLSNRDGLGADSGMLFIFHDQAIRNFWMKDMRFALDVLWIAGGRVVGWQENIPWPAPGREPVRFQSPVPADAVLEVNSGWIRKHGVQIGEQVLYPQMR